MNQKIILGCYVATIAIVNAVTIAQDSHLSRTFCNPLPIPNYPIGKLSRDVRTGTPASEWQWRLGYQEQFRELADVSALWDEGRWILYPSVDMAWVSVDGGGTWTHHPLNVRDLGYAPTVVRHRGKYLLMASDSPIYESESPLGPFTKLGSISLKRSGRMSGFIDPMLFSDDDERLYYYWGCSPNGGIWGVELDVNDPTRVLGEPTELIPFDPKQFPWEAVGEWNQNPRNGWMEGPWLLKHNGKYYLTYSAGGTENRTYAMGCYVGDTPMGPFIPQAHNPILRTVDGLVTGTAHGCIVAGPDEELFAFYTIRAGVVHAFERRLGMDRADINAEGELTVLGATQLPQWLPGFGMKSSDKNLNGENDPHWLPLNDNMQTIGSSDAPNLPGRFAVDHEMRTWWQPEAIDAQPTLTTGLMAPATVYAARVLWRDVGLDTQNKHMPGAIRYRIELKTEHDRWVSIIDRSQSQDDLLIDYRECNPTVGTKARLVVLEWPVGITPAVAEFTLFGQTIP